jgi:squalene-hopene/tetraprenyl-beta-curcumene cyclase
MHSNLNTRLVIAALCVLSLGLRPARGDDPEKKGPNEAALQQGRKAIERGLTFLENDAAKWRKEHGCATCHHGTMTVWALSEAKSQGYDVDARALADMVQWTKDRFVPRSTGPQAPGPGLANVALIYLGMMSQNLPILSRDEIHRIALHLAGRQAADGAWDSPPPKNGPPPTWESRETLAMLALLAWEPYVLADPKEAAAARASRDKAEAWLSKPKPSGTTQALALRLLLDAHRGTADKQLQSRIDRLLKRQNYDGGWGQTKDLASDAYATGQALYALSFANVKNDRPVIQRAVSFLATSQREDGSWRMISRGHPGVKPFTNPVPITYFGTAWATLGLARTVAASPVSAARQQRAFDEIRRYQGKPKVKVER